MQVGLKMQQLDGHTYELENNDSPHHIHGGSKGSINVSLIMKLLMKLDKKIIFTTTIKEMEDHYPEI